MTKKLILILSILSTPAMAQYNNQSGFSTEAGGTRFYQYNNGNSAIEYNAGGTRFYQDSTGRSCITNNAGGTQFTNCSGGYDR